VERRIVLIAGGDAVDAAHLRAALEQHGADTFHCAAATMFAACERLQPDAIVLYAGDDIHEAIARLRQRFSTPLLVVGAEDAPERAAELLLSGADDYVRDAINEIELAARVVAIFRRYEGRKLPVSVGALMIDHDMRSATVNGQDLGLTPTEFRLIEGLTREGSRAVFRQDLVDYVWGPSSGVSAHALCVVVSRLRQKLRPAEDVRVETVPGIGYRLRARSSGAVPGMPTAEPAVA
jgi:two-component system KDP operon response regulator KdpE